MMTMLTKTSRRTFDAECIDICCSWQRGLILTGHGHPPGLCPGVFQPGRLRRLAQPSKRPTESSVGPLSISFVRWHWVFSIGRGQQNGASTDRFERSPQLVKIHFGPSRSKKGSIAELRPAEMAIGQSSSYSAPFAHPPPRAPGGGGQPRWRGAVKAAARSRISAGLALHNQST